MDDDFGLNWIWQFDGEVWPKHWTREVLCEVKLMRTPVPVDRDAGFQIRAGGRSRSKTIIAGSKSSAGGGEKYM